MHPDNYQDVRDAAYTFAVLNIRGIVNGFINQAPDDNRRDWAWKIRLALDEMEEIGIGKLPFPFPGITNNPENLKTAFHRKRKASEAHPDDIAVDQFARAMKDKLRVAREQKGRGGWQQCSTPDLARMMFDHIAKGDMVDVANFAMMLWHNLDGRPVLDIPNVVALEARAKELEGALKALHDSYIKVCPFANLVAQQARGALSKEAGR